jgi:hypothetical protein
MEISTEEKPVKTMSEPRVKKLISIYERLKGDRASYEGYWQSLHDYFYIESSDVSTLYSAGSELNANNLYDATTLDAGDVLASGFMNYLTPPTSKWFGLRHRSQEFKDNKNVQRYLEDVAAEAIYTLNRSNFYDQMFSSYKSSGVYGTSVILEEEDIEDDARFYTLPIKQVCLSEDGRGRVTEYFIEFEYTAMQAASRWGIEKLSGKMQEEAKEESRKDKKHLFLLFIGNRYVRDISKSDKRNLPIEAIWIDLENKMTIDEGGYNEFPAMCHRFDKRPFIPWGFSPAMKALPFARILNAIAKTNLRAMMKHTDPPIAIPDNAFMMPFNFNPRAVNYYDKSKMEGKDIFSFGNFGDPNVGMTAIEYYSQKVKTLMYNDVFLAFDGLTKQMNNPEVMERINEKMTMLGPSVGRYISEMLNPAVIRTIGILFRRGKLPTPPDELIQDPNYEIDCISQLAQAQRRSEMNSLMSGLQLIGQIAPMIPDVLDKVSADKVVDETWSILGAPVKVLRDDAEIDALRESRGRMAQQQMAMENLERGAGVVKTGSEVDKNLAASAQVGKK